MSVDDNVCSQRGLETHLMKAFCIKDNIKGRILLSG